MGEGAEKNWKERKRKEEGQVELTGLQRDWAGFSHPLRWGQA